MQLLSTAKADGWPVMLMVQQHCCTWQVQISCAVCCTTCHVQGAQRLSSAAAKGVPWCSCRFAAMCRRCWTAAVCIYIAGHLKGHLCCRKHTHADACVAQSTVKIKMVHMACECQCLCIIVQLLCEFALSKCLLSHWHSIPVLLSCRCIAFSVWRPSALLSCCNKQH